MIEQRTDAWLSERSGKVTASMIYAVMMKPTTAGYRDYQAQLIAERLTGVPQGGDFTNAAMQHGIDTEPQARAMYELESGNDVTEIGFVSHPSLEWAGASPDGLIRDDGLVEIKCPKTATHLATLSGAPIDRKYLLQMHWQMICCERDWCDFVSFDPRLPVEMQMHIQRVERDVTLTSEITEAAERFLAETAETVAALSEKYLKENA